MEKMETKNSELSKILITFGVLILIISLIDVTRILFPLQMADAGWIFATTKEIISSVLVPALCIVLLLAGIYLNHNYPSNKKLLKLTQIISFLSFLIGTALVLNLISYSLSIKSYEAKLTSAIKLQQESILKEINELKKSPKLNIPEEAYNIKVNEINNAASKRIKTTKNALFKASIVMIAELLLYIILYMSIGKIAYNSSRQNLLKLKFGKKE